MLYEDITRRVIGAAMAVHSTLVNGFQEVIYQRAMEIELLYAGRGGLAPHLWVMKPSSVIASLPTPPSAKGGTKPPPYCRVCPLRHSWSRIPHGVEIRHQECR